MLVIKTDMTYTVTQQTTHILPPAGPPKRSRREPQEAVSTASRWSRARGIDDGVPAMGPDEGPGSKTRAEAAVWGHGEPRARKTALGREELLYKNPAWVASEPNRIEDLFYRFSLRPSLFICERFHSSSVQMQFARFSNTFCGTDFLSHI